MTVTFLKRFDVERFNVNTVLCKKCLLGVNTAPAGVFYHSVLAFLELNSYFKVSVFTGGIIESFLPFFHWEIAADYAVGF